MADFVAVLKKTIDGLGDTTPEMRERVYVKARSTVAAKLAAINPPPAEAVIERKKKSLEDAIAQDVAIKTFCNLADDRTEDHVPGVAVPPLIARLEVEW